MSNTGRRTGVHIFIYMLLISNVCHGQVIVLDPGHNFDDIATGYRSATEVFTNWDVANRTKELIQTYTDYNVFLTRQNNDPGSENYVSLSAREDIANQLEAAFPGEVLFLSIHCNAGGGTGSETFFCNKSYQSDSLLYIFAKNVQDEMVMIGGWRDRRCVEDETYLGFHLGVLDGLMMPNALNEIGFVDNPFDAEKLLDSDWRDCFALAYLKAFLKSTLCKEVGSLPVCSKVNIDGYVQNAKVKLFPNPCFDYVHIETDEKPLVISVFSMNGRQFYPEMKILDRKATIWMDRLPAGIYIIRVLAGDDVHSTFCMHLQHEEFH